MTEQENTNPPSQDQLIQEIQRRDKIIVAVEQQRNEALTKNVNLMADNAEAKEMIEALIAEVNRLNTVVQEANVKPPNATKRK